MAETLEYVVSVRGGAQGAAQVRKLESAVSAAGGTMTRFGGASEKAAKRGAGFTSGLKGMVVQLGLVAGAYKVVSAAKGAVAYTKTLAEGSAALDKATGLGIQRSSRMLAVAEALDIPTGALATSFKSLSKAAVKQAEDSGKTATAFDKLGITTKFVRDHQHNFNAILDKTLERLSAMPKGIKKNTLESELFGKSFLKLNPLIGGGAQNLHRLLGIASKYGAELKGTDATKQLEELREAQVESRLASDGLRISFTKLAGPSLVSLLKGFAQLKNDIRTNNMADFGKQINKVAEVGEKALVIFEEHAIEGMGQTGPKLAKALWHGFSTASTQNQGLMIGAMLLKFGVAGKAFGFVGGHLADLFTGSFRRRSVKGVAGAAAKSAAVVGAEDAAFAAAGTSAGGAFSAAFALALPAAAAAALGYSAYVVGKTAMPGNAAEPFGNPYGRSVDKHPETKQEAAYTKKVREEPVMTLLPNGKLVRNDPSEITAAPRHAPHHHAPHAKAKAHAGSVTHSDGAHVRDIHVHIDGRKLFTVNARQALLAQAAGE